MPARPVRLLMACFGLAAVAAIAPSGASAAIPFRGVDIGGLSTQSPQDVDNDLARVHRLHANVVRVEFPWRDFQPSQGGGLDPAATRVADALVNRAHVLGVKVIATLDSTPCWASSAPPDLLASCHPTDQSPPAGAYPPADPNTFAQFAGLIAQRYRGKLAAIEVWNEPDHQQQYYFAGPDKPHRYAGILRAAYRAIKRADRHILVLAGSLVGANGAFLSALYANGIKGSYDAISVHYYDLVLASIRAIRDTQVKHGDHKPLWLIEFGWTTCLPALTQGGHACVNSQVQARDLSDIYAALSRTSWVQAAVIFDLRDYSAYDFGLLTQDGVPKPAFATMARVFATGRARLQPVRLRLTRQGGRVVASGSTPAGDAMEIDANIGPSLRWKATFAPDRYDRFKIALPANLGTHGIRVHVYQYWSGAGTWASV